MSANGDSFVNGKSHLKKELEYNNNPSTASTETSLDSGLISSEDLDQIRAQLLEEITASGIVSREFCYQLNPFMNTVDQTFFASVSYIDKRFEYIYMQPEDYVTDMEKMTEELDYYYSEPISEQWLVRDIYVGLVCVGKYDEVYHRIQIKEEQSLMYIITYVDLGITVEVEKTTAQFKYLLNYFANSPCMVLPCRLAHIECSVNNDQMILEVYNYLTNSHQDGPFRVESYGQIAGVLYIKLFNDDQLCLNDLLIEKGLAIKAPVLSITDTRNDKNQQANQCFQSSVNSKQKSVNPIQKIDTTPKTTIPNQKMAMDDYDDALYTATVNSSMGQSIVQSTTNRQVYDDYMEDSSSTRNNRGAKSRAPNLKNNTKRDTQLDKKKPATIIRNTNSTNQYDQRDRPNNENRVPFTITIKRSNPNLRIFTQALASLSLNEVRNQRQISPAPIIINAQKKDDFASWMCSWSVEQSLWSSEVYKNSLLKYIGRIYNQVAHMYRFFTQLKNDLPNLDELDVLNKLIENTKERQNAKKSFDEWKDDSRINRRLKDLNIIFEFNTTSRSSNHPFKIFPNNLQQIIDRKKIRSYFDLGCGDGTITAAIGSYLNLTKENIFGGDVFIGQNHEITFIKLNENQSTIRLPNNSVDLITVFVTFHHVAQIKETLKELARILRPNGYLILREHDCKNEHSLSAKYLNFVHAIMMIAGVGEFANSSNNSRDENQHMLNEYENDTVSWPEQKRRIIEYTKTIYYRTCDEWSQELGHVGFHHCATLYYGANGSDNPQKLFYAVYQLNKK